MPESTKTLDGLLDAIAAGSTLQVYLVVGDAVLAEPAARRIAERLAGTASEDSVLIHRRPSQLSPVLDDLRTYSLFSSTKVVVVVESALLADRSAAADLIDDVEKALPLGDSNADLSPQERQAAGRLLQVFHLFRLDPQAGEAKAALDQLPRWVFQGGGTRKRGGKKARTKRQVEGLSQELAKLLEAARRAALHGWAETETNDLAAVIRDGLPSGHALVLAESHVAPDHPLLAQLEGQGAVIRTGHIEADRRGGFAGLDLLHRELESQTGSGIHPDALAELARRTLRKPAGWGRAREEIDPNSTARLAAEYKKLAVLAERGKIDLALVERAVEDRGEEDVWQLLDAVGEGRGEEALSRLKRLLGAAEDPVAARLSLFALLADFCRQLAAVRCLMEIHDVPAHERSFNRFKSRHAPRLQGQLPDGSDSPVGKLHPYRLFRIYAAAGRLPRSLAGQLPSLTLATELRLKGESGEPEVALAHLIATITLASAKR